MASKADYDIRQDVERTILAHGGTIFGGHVRDTILREAHSSEYVTKGIICDKYNAYMSPALYDDPTFLPEYRGRMMVSTDIDCYMVSHRLRDFFRDLDTANIWIHVLFEREDAKRYLPSIDVANGVLRHIRCVVCNTRPFYIDIMVARCRDFHLYSPPFGHIDFECNGLILTNAGMTMSPNLYPELSVIERYDKLGMIIGDIKHMNAVYVDAEDLTAYRIEKMQSKGWRINFKIIQKDTKEKDKDMCIICHDEIDADYKLPCCSAHYHPRCLVQAMVGGSEFTMERTSKCIMCKQYTSAYTEANLLRLIAAGEKVI